MTTTHPKPYGFTDLCADMWLGSKLARKIEADAEKTRSLVDKKLAKKGESDAEKLKPKRKEPEEKEIRVMPVCCLAPCLYVVSMILIPFTTI